MEVTMKIIRLVGRLGNQMFIYAFAKAVEYYSKEKVYFDLSFLETHPRDTFELENIFDIKLNIASTEDINKICKRSPFYKINFIKNHKKIFHILLWDNITREKEYNRFQPKLLTKKGDVYYDGYFQSEKYFEKIKDEIKKEFKFKHVTNESLLQKREKIEQLECPIFINVRRGDYVTLANNNVVNWLCDNSYYAKATKLMKEKFPNCTFIAISDEPEWLKNNLKIDYPYEILSSETPYMDIFLLQACKHGICANSSYSWWGAWLIDNPDKVIIAPDPWVEPDRIVDIIPDNWIKIPRF